MSATELPGVSAVSQQGDDGPAAKRLGKAKEAAAALKEPLLRVQHKPWHAFDMTAKDASDAVVAELSTSLLSQGKWTVSFPADSAFEPRPRHEAFRGGEAGL